MNSEKESKNKEVWPVKLQGTFMAVRREPGAKDKGAFRMRRKHSDDIIICNGCGWNLKKGTPLVLSGEWENEETGIFSVSDLDFDTNDRDRCIRFFSKSHFRGIGEKIAGKLYDRLKEKGDEAGKSFDQLSMDEVFSVMDQLKLAEAKIQFYTAISGINLRKSILSFMGCYGVSPKNVEQIYHAYGENYKEEISRSPYDAMIFGIPFQVCDKIAWEISHDIPWNETRMKAVLKQFTNKVGNEGSCCIRIQDAVQYIHYLLKNSPFDYMPESVIYTELVSSDQFVIRETESYGIVVYPKYYYYVERDIVSEIRRLCNSKEDLGYVSYRGKSNLDEYQIKAMDLLKNSGVKILYGGPGAGKTTTIQEFIAEFRKLRPEENVILCAPTGRAAARITESCKTMYTGNEEDCTYNALTVHKLLGVLPYESGMKCNKNSDDPLPKGLFILDEVSMMDELLFLRFLQAVPNGSLVILSGDPDQLPSVLSGTVLRDLIDSGVLESQKLSGNHRQNGGSIVENYKKLQNIDPNLIEDESFQIIRVNDSKETLSWVKKLYEQYYTDDCGEFQILTALKKGDIGKNRINQMISEWRSEAVTSAMFSGLIRKGIYSVGDRIIMTANNYNKGYWNGDVGVIRSIEPGGEFRIQFYDGIRTVDQEASNDMEHAFATTVHKSQGSEYRYVVFVQDPEYPSMMYRSLFLTAITRAKEKVFLISTDNCIRKSIQTDKEAKRITGLKEMLQTVF